MKYCVMCSLRLDTPSKRDILHNDIQLKIGGKKVWGEALISSGKDEQGYPNNALEIRFDTEADMNEVFAFLKDKMEKIPVLKGSVSKHYCTHDEILARPCVIAERFEK